MSSTDQEEPLGASSECHGRRLRSVARSCFFSLLHPSIMQEDFAAIQRIDALPSTSAAASSKSSAAAAPPTPTARTLAGPSSKLEPFLLLAKSARGAGAAALIDQATAAPGVFVFAELTETKAVAEVSTGGYRRCRDTTKRTDLLSDDSAASKQRAVQKQVAAAASLCVWQPRRLPWYGQITHGYMRRSFTDLHVHLQPMHQSCLDSAMPSSQSSRCSPSSI